ncbi:MAG: hypothetical protein AB1553_01975 [Nitrospirota bacterium]
MRWNIFSRLFSKAPSGSFDMQLRPRQAQGPYTQKFEEFFTRKVEGAFYEFLRKTMPVIDGAINRLTALDGYPDIEGDNEALVEEIKDWWYNVPVNQLQKGVHAYQQALTSEAWEQGFGFGEPVYDKKRSDIIGLNTADSLTFTFKQKDDGTFEVLQKGYGDSTPRPLDLSRLDFFSVNCENGDPRGVPLMRSCEIVSRTLATIFNSLQNVWERFGDPSFSLVYKSLTKDQIDLEARRQKLSTDLSNAVRSKREGKSVDFVSAIHKDAEIKLEIIGAVGQVLDVEMPMRALLEQIVAKTGLPPWMFGLRWSTTQGLSDSEAEMILADVKTRQAAKTPLLYRLVRELLLLRGRTWKPGDWTITWKTVNLHDLVKQAQARFLNGQADMYYMQNAERAGIEISREDLALGKEVRAKGVIILTGKKETGSCSCGAHHGLKELQRTQPWPELDKVESDYEGALKARWAELRDVVFTILKLPYEGKSVKGPEDVPPIEAFSFSDEQRTAVMRAYKDWYGSFDIDDPSSPVRWYYGQSYSLGLIQAAKMIGKERPILDIIKNREIYDELCRSGFSLLKDNATKAIVERILPEMEAQMLAGTNPRHVATRLEKLFGNANSDWERLARSEMSMAAEEAKVDEWKEWDVDVKNAVIPVKDTHPRCRCSNTIKEKDGKFFIAFTPAPDACAICVALAQ